MIAYDNLHNMEVYSDASYAVHIDIRKHTGGFMSMSWEMVHCCAFFKTDQH